MHPDVMTEVIINALTLCQLTGIQYQQEHKKNPCCSLATYTESDIQFRARQIAKFVQTHGWCQIHLTPDSHIQLSFKRKGDTLNVEFVTTEDAKRSFFEVIQELKVKVKSMLQQIEQK